MFGLVWFAPRSGADWPERNQMVTTTFLWERRGASLPPRKKGRGRKKSNGKKLSLFSKIALSCTGSMTEEKMIWFGLVWVGLVGTSFDASLEPALRKPLLLATLCETKRNIPADIRTYTGTVWAYTGMGIHGAYTGIHGAVEGIFDVYTGTYDAYVRHICAHVVRKHAYMGPTGTCPHRVLAPHRVHVVKTCNHQCHRGLRIFGFEPHLETD